MRILVLYPYLPYPLDRGTYQRTFHLLVQLAKVHSVTLVALAERGEGVEHRSVFEQICERVEVIPFEHPPWPKLIPQRLFSSTPPNVAHWTLPKVAPTLAKVCEKTRFDAVHVCDIVMAQYFPRHNHRMVIDRSRVDLQYQLAEHATLKLSLKTRLLRYEGYLKLWFYERKLASRASFEIVCGPDDEAFLRRWIRRDMAIEVLVNGVDPDYFAPDSRQSRSAQPTVLFCGTMDYNPNIDALRWYFAEMDGPLRELVPELKVLIVGKNPLPEVREYGKLQHVTVTGSVPDVRPFYRRAWVQIVPLRIGGGTRLKIVESMAIGTPVVSTSIGAQGLGLTHGRDILLADTAERFVRETARALCSSKLRDHLQEAGLDAVCSRFSWDGIGAQLNDIYARRLSAAA